MDQAVPASYATSPYKHGKALYRDVLERWPHTTDKQGMSRRKRKDIAVLGAGISGLVAGLLLKAAGHNVNIFEAGNTVGGRIKTLRSNFTSGFYAEAGAMRIPSHHTLTLDLAKTFGLSCLEFPKECPGNNALYYINNRRSTFGEYARDKPDFGFNLAEGERGLSSWDLLTRHIFAYLKNKEAEFGWKDMSFAKLNDDIALDETDKVFRHLDQFSLYDFLLTPSAESKNPELNNVVSILSKEAANYICATQALEMSMSSSMAYVMHMLRTLFAAEKLYQIRDGMDRLPHSLIDPNRNSRSTAPDEQPGRSIDWLRESALNLGEDIRYNTRILELSYPDGKSKAKSRDFRITVQFENVILRRPESAHYDLVVIALPFSALRHVRMKDLASPEKRRAFRQLHYDNACFSSSPSHSGPIARIS